MQGTVAESSAAVQARLGLEVENEEDAELDEIIDGGKDMAKEGEIPGDGEGEAEESGEEEEEEASGQTTIKLRHSWRRVVQDELRYNKAGDIRGTLAWDTKFAREVPIGRYYAKAEQNAENLIPICSSTVTVEELTKLRFDYSIPRYIEMMIPGADQTLYNPPKGYVSVFNV